MDGAAYGGGRRRHAGDPEAQRRSEHSRARSRALFFLGALITYGSLYPFDFSVPRAHSAAWWQFATDWSPVTSKADALGNIALFFPFGFAGALTPRRGRELAVAIGVLALSFALATAVQMVQIYVPARTAAMGDVFWNMLGATLGVLSAFWLGRRLRFDAFGAEPAHVLPAGLLALWLIAELVPFVPSLDLGSMKASLRALLHPALAADQAAWQAAAAMIAGWSLAVLLGEARTRTALPALACAVVAAKVIVVTQTVDASLLLGLALGVSAWLLVMRWSPTRRDAACLIALLLAYVIGALAPYEISSFGRDFSWVPFEATLRGSLLVNSKALLANVLLFSGILGLVRASGASPVVASIGLAVLVALFEALQMYLPGRSADITEPLLVLLVGQLLRLAPPPGAPGTAGAPSPIPPRTRTPARPRTGVPRLAALAATCIAIAFALAMVLRMPQMPYNVMELFRRDAAWYVLLTFSLALLWIGAGGRLVARVAARAARPWLVLPLAALGAGLVSYVLLSYAVTQESFADITGSTDLYRRVTAENAWGNPGRELFLWIGSPDLVAFFERPVRFAALYAPVVTFLALMFMPADLRSAGRLNAARLVPLLVSAALWLWLCGAITFLWPTTDNLTELIAQGGLPFLYGLLALMCANSVELAHLRPTPLRLALGSGLTLLLVGVGWWLLNLGLEARVNKEELGVVFSAVQFLLGPDRTNLLPPETLFARWAAVQLAAVLVMALGARFAAPRYGN